MKLVLETSYLITGSYGYSVIIMSIAVNFALLPLYLLAEKWQDYERDIKKKMKGELDKINNAFTGEMRHYYTTAVYRRFKYNPLSAVRVSLGFFIQVPFFFAAYHFLSHYKMLEGVGFWFLDDLSLPDAVVKISGDTLNIMPLVMTAVNIISSYIYAKTLEKREKIQLWGLAGAFLVLLYNSASGLLLYWTCNNIFSLVKNYIIRAVVEKEKIITFRWKNLSFKKAASSRKLFYIYLLTGFSALYLVFFHYKYLYAETRYSAFLIAMFLFLLISLYSIVFLIINFRVSKRYIAASAFIGIFAAVLIFISVDYFFKLDYFSSTRVTRKLYLAFFLALNMVSLPLILKRHGNITEISSGKKSVYFSAVLYAVLVIFVFSPLRLYASAPGELEISLLSLFLYSLTAAAGGIAVSAAVFFAVPTKIKSSFIFAAVLASVLVFFYTFLYPGDFGNLNKFALTKAYRLNGEILKYIFELCLVVSVFCTVLLIVKRKKAAYFIFAALASVSFIQTSVSVIDMVKVKNSAEMSAENLDLIPEYNSDIMTFSKTGNNIVVILLDMCTGGYIPQIRDGLADFDNIFSGFTWYPNSLSSGYHTSTSISVMRGGWKYQSENLNKRKDKKYYEHIADSYHVVPDILDNYGYLSAFVNPDYYLSPNGNLSELRKRGITAGYSKDYIQFWKSENGYTADSRIEDSGSMNYRFLLAVSLFKASPFLFKPFIYNNGEWILIGQADLSKSIYNQVLKSWGFLDSMDKISSVDERGNTFKFLHNHTTHSPYAIDKDGNLTNDYPDPEVKDYSRGRAPYYSAKASFRAVSNWIEWLKDEGIYDNTKIILVSDHGNNLGHDPMKRDDFDFNEISDIDYTRSHILLMVKDFGEKGNFKSDDRFMSNGDLASIICSGLDTGGVISPDRTKGTPEEGRVLDFVKSNSWRWESIYTEKEIKYDFVYRVRDNIFDPDNWTKIK